MENNPNTLDLHNTLPVRPQEQPAHPQMPEMPQMPQMPASKKFGSKLVWIILAAVILAGAAAWWYVSNMAPEPVVQDQPRIDQEARQDTLISSEINSVDLGDLDKEFEEIDKDLNSL